MEEDIDRKLTLTVKELQKEKEKYEKKIRFYEEVYRKGEVNYNKGKVDCINMLLKLDRKKVYDRNKSD